MCVFFVFCSPEGQFTCVVCQSVFLTHRLLQRHRERANHFGYNTLIIGFLGSFFLLLLLSGCWVKTFRLLHCSSALHDSNTLWTVARPRATLLGERALVCNSPERSEATYMFSRWIAQRIEQIDPLLCARCFSINQCRPRLPVYQRGGCINFGPLSPLRHDQLSDCVAEAEAAATPRVPDLNSSFVFILRVCLSVY